MNHFYDQGRRHSVAVPVIPPPPGVMFEGGYHIQKNPINGAAVLVPPKGLLFQSTAAQQLVIMARLRSTELYELEFIEQLILRSLPAKITFHKLSVEIQGQKRRKNGRRIFILIYSSCNLQGLHKDF